MYVFVNFIFFFILLYKFNKYYLFKLLYCYYIFMYVNWCKMFMFNFDFDLNVDILLKINIKVLYIWI